MPTAELAAHIGGLIYYSLLNHVLATTNGRAYPDNLGYAVAMLPSGRESFAPDASYHRGPFPQNPMRFIEPAPHFAVEVRSKSNYSSDAELEMADKQADYFQAGTVVVWDVDTLAQCIHAYRAFDPEHPVTFHRGDIADAAPAVPGWRVAVDWIFS